jgi:DnaJ-class molecular chaperone
MKPTDSAAMPDLTQIEWTACPMCKGEGYTPSPHRDKQDPPCPLCKGGGEVPRGEICGCGLPPVVLDETTQILFCGKDACLKQLVEDADEEDSHALYMRDYGMYRDY